MRTVGQRRNAVTRVLAVARLASALATLSISVAGVAQVTNLVVGGGFESPSVPAGAQYLLSVTPAGWTGTGDLTTQGYAGSVSSGNGSQWLDLNPDTGAGTGISQTINLNAGTSYNFSFLYDGGGGVPNPTTQIAYSLGKQFRHDLVR
jgi:hypothetical protein